MVSILKVFFLPMISKKTDKMITAHSCGRTRSPAVWYLLLFMSVYACSSRSRSSPVFYGAFSLQAARFMRSQAGIHPGRLFSFQGVNTSVAWPFLLLTPMGLRRIWMFPDLRKNKDYLGWNYSSFTWAALSIISLIVEIHFFLLYFPENNCADQYGSRNKD